MSKRSPIFRLQVGCQTDALSLPRPLAPSTTDFFWQRWSLSVLVLLSCGGVEAYLTGRGSRAHVGLELSWTIPMCSGAPKGSVIRPFLFLLFVNDLTDALWGTNVALSGRSYTERKLLKTSKINLSIDPVQCSYIKIGREVPLPRSFETGFYLIIRDRSAFTPQMICQSGSLRRVVA